MHVKSNFISIMSPFSDLHIVSEPETSKRPKKPFEFKPSFTQTLYQQNPNGIPSLSHQNLQRISSPFLINKLMSQNDFFSILQIEIHLIMTYTVEKTLKQEKNLITSAFNEFCSDKREWKKESLCKFSRKRLIYVDMIISKKTNIDIHI